MENIICPQYTLEQLHIFDEIPSGVLSIVKDDDNSMKYVYSNQYLADYLGYTNDELREILYEDCYALIYEADRDKTRNVRRNVLEGGIADSISRQKKKDGSYVWILAHVRQVEVDGKIGLIFFFSKIEELIGLQNELTAKNEELIDITNSIPIGIMVFKIENGITTTLSVNNTLIDVANSVGSQLDSQNRNWTEAEFAMIFNQDIFAFCENEDIPIAKQTIKDSEIKTQSSCVFRLRGSSMGKTIYIYATCASKKISENERVYYMTYQNVTENEERRLELVEKQKQLYKMSYYDALTGVKSRNAYNELKSKCKKNPIKNAGVVFCDLNGLKYTNDTLGHQFGDKLIIDFVSIIKEYFEMEYIYRLSGDEFIIIQSDIERSEFQNIMRSFVNRIGQEDNIASVGYIWKDCVSDIQRRITQAEQIMYVEKQKYYETSRNINSKHRSRFLDELLKDFEDERFIMYLQPKTAIDESRIIGAEALARKLSPSGKIIQPYEFVPQLENEKLIPKLDFFILEEACKLLQGLHKEGNDSFSISANISRITIAENEFIENVNSILNKYEFERKNLEFEITETNETMDFNRFEEYLAQIKKLGIHISLDDVGTDYSTLTLLTLEGLDWIKLDRSLIIQMGQEKARIILNNVIKMCHELNLKVIAEGVETEEDRVTLMNMGCDAYQGYLKSKPIPLQDFKDRFL